jgi:cytochrome o ubiquinol oxidase operon protein cyoD
MANHAAELSLENTSGQKTLGAYVTGLVLCLVLTFFAFALVYSHQMSTVMLDTTLAGLAIIQLLVQCICFLRLNMSKEGQWNVLPFLFALLIIFILAGGSLWIMANLNYFMMH